MQQQYDVLSLAHDRVVEEQFLAAARAFSYEDGVWGARIVSCFRQGIKVAVGELCAHGYWLCEECYWPRQTPLLTVHHPWLFPFVGYGNGGRRAD